MFPVEVGPLHIGSILCGTVEGWPSACSITGESAFDYDISLLTGVLTNLVPINTTMLKEYK